MGSKDNPRRIRNKLIAGGLTTMLLAGGGYEVYSQHVSIKEQEVLIHEYQKKLLNQEKVLDEQGSLIDQKIEELSIQKKQVDSLKETIEEDKKKQESYQKEIEKLKEELAYKKEQEALAKQLAKQQAATVQPSRSKSDVVTKSLVVEASGYIALCKEGCTGITATGMNLKDNPHAKVIAVDPRVIPLGTKVYIPGYGYAVAADTGGAIKGNKIDLHFPTEQAARQWGRKNVTIEIISSKEG